MGNKFSEAEKYLLVERFHNGESISNICLSAGVARSTFYTWIKPYKTEITEAGTVVSATEFAQMKRRVKRLEQMVKILRTVDCTFSAPLKEKLYALELPHSQYDVRVLCDALEVSRGTYYNHVLRNKKKKNSYQARRDILSEQIRQVYEESEQVYGAKKIVAVLKQQGVFTSDKMVSELMQEMHLQSMRTDAKKIHMRLQKEKRDGKKKDALKMDFSVSAPNQVWVSDTTVFKFDGIAYFICAILDLYSKKVIAHKISRKHSSQLVTGTFKVAYAERDPQVGLIFHSDQGAQYVSNAIRKLLAACDVTQSFSPTGMPHHNAVIESFFASLTREELYRVDYHSAKEFKDRTAAHMVKYNNKRLHSTLKIITPEAHERRFYRMSAAKTG